MSPKHARTFALSLAPVLAAALALSLPLTANAQEQNEQNGSAAKADRAGQPAVTLPNGASSINETYGDWTVNCAIADNRKTCAFSQEQGNSQTGQRLFGVELQPANPEGQTNGVLLLPFGLKLDDGVKLKIDGQNLGQGARFSTCVPAGCLVPVSFPKPATDALRKGEKFIVTATREGGSGEPPTFSVSLNGFTAAMNRVAELAK